MVTDAEAFLVLSTSNLRLELGPTPIFSCCTVASKLYGISSLVQEIVNQEAEFCYAEDLGISLTFPEFKIDKLTTGETLIYSIEHEDSKEKFRFALRTCVIPPSLGL